jgi:hypothetical protein
LFSPFWLFQAKGVVSSTIQTVDASGKMGSYVSLALDSKGNPGISYYDSTNYNLKYAHWNGIQWEVQTVDSDFMSGLHTAIAFDAIDRPHISYDGKNALRYAYWNGAAWEIQYVDAAGSFTSIAIDVNGYPHISYYGVQNGNYLKYASWTGSSWNIQTVDSNAYVGEFTSLKLDSEGYPQISYWDFGKNFANENLKVARYNSMGCNIEIVDSVHGVGEFTSLDIDRNGNTHISYYDRGNGDLKYAVSNGSAWNIQVVDSGGDVGTDSSLALDSQGNPHISYTDNTNHVLKYASWEGSLWKIISLRSAGNVGEYTSLPNDQTSLKIDKDDNAHIAYCDWGYRYLKYFTVPDATGLAAKYLQPSALLNVNSNPVGVGQTVSINMTLVPRPPATIDRYSNLTLSIIYPDRNNVTLGPFLSENGSVFLSFAPTQVGPYSLQLKYPGQVFLTTNTTYYPAQSKIVILNVWQQPPPIPTPTPAPSPTPTPTSQTINQQQNDQSNHTLLQPQNYSTTIYQNVNKESTQEQQPQKYSGRGLDSVTQFEEGLVIASIVVVPILLVLKKVID